MIPPPKLSTIAYFANQFPSAVEPYVMEEIAELRRRGFQVIPCSVWRAEKTLSTDLRVFAQQTLYFRQLRWGILIGSVFLCIKERSKLSGLTHTIFRTGTESRLRRAKAILHTWLGAYYALLLQPLRVQHIHVHHGYFSAWIAMVAARLLEIDFTMTLHGSDLLLRAAFMDTKLQNCAACFTISEYNRQYIRQNFPEIAPRKIILRRLGVEVPSCDSTRLRAQPTLFTVLSVGRLHAVKDHSFLLEACATLRQRGVNFLCLIAGKGPERQSLERQIVRLGLQREVKLLGHVPHAGLGVLYARADLVVLTSRSEGIPLTLMEAMAYGRPVLAPNITGIPELVEDGKTGFLYQPRSLSDFITRVEMIRKRSAALDPLCRAARQRVLTHFNREQHLQEFINHLLFLVPQNTGSQILFGDHGSAHGCSREAASVISPAGSCREMEEKQKGVPAGTVP